MDKKDSDLLITSSKGEIGRFTWEPPDEVMNHLRLLRDRLEEVSARGAFHFLKEETAHAVEGVLHLLSVALLSSRHAGEFMEVIRSHLEHAFDSIGAAIDREVQNEAEVAASRGAGVSAGEPTVSDVELLITATGRFGTFSWEMPRHVRDQFRALDHLPAAERADTIGRIRDQIKSYTAAHLNGLCAAVRHLPNTGAVQTVLDLVQQYLYRLAGACERVEERGGWDPAVNAMGDFGAVSWEMPRELVRAIGEFRSAAASDLNGGDVLQALEYLRGRPRDLLVAFCHLLCFACDPYPGSHPPAAFERIAHRLGQARRDLIRMSKEAERKSRRRPQ